MIHEHFSYGLCDFFFKNFASYETDIREKIFSDGINFTSKLFATLSLSVKTEVLTSQKTYSISFIK
jgi:uncharacterized protein with ParB-like and HNH nuclease domain